MLKGIQYEKFVDYKTDLTSDRLPLPSPEYWYTLEDVLTAYVRHNDNKFDYVDGIAHRKHIIADRIRYIGKETNNLDETMVTGIDDNSYLEYENLREFYDWVLNLKPKDVRDKGISQQSLYKVKTRIKSGNHLNLNVKVVKILLKLYGDLKTDSGN
jgi:hypothetical protein